MYQSTRSTKTTLPPARKHWLNPQRLALYSGAFAILFAYSTVAWLIHARNGLDTAGNPLGYDFIAFWSTSHIGLHEHPVLAYDVPHLTAVEKAAATDFSGQLAWRYPPPFYLLVLPFSLLPLYAAWGAFAFGTLALYVSAFRRVLTSPRALLCLAAFGPAWSNLLAGQTGFLTASLAAGALLCLGARPLLAGVLIGLLCIKPHLALLFPLCLIAAGAWRTFLAAAITVIGITLVSVAVLGVDTVPAFLHGLHEVQHQLEVGESPWHKMPSVFVSLRRLHVPIALAYAAHSGIALLAAGAVWRIWRRSNDSRLRNAALMAATFFISPYVFDYDMVWLAFPVAWFVLYCMEHGWLRFEREILVLLWISTLSIPAAADVTVTHIVPIPLGLLMWLIYRRACEERQPLHNPRPDKVI